MGMTKDGKNIVVRVPLPMHREWKRISKVADDIGVRVGRAQRLLLSEITNLSDKQLREKILSLLGRG